MTGDYATERVNPVPTERFQRVLAFASEEADGLGHAFVTCQHLLYALSQENKGLASAVLDELGATAGKLHALLADSDASHDRLPNGHVDLADEVRDVIGRAVNAARLRGHHTLDTEHILYGIVIAPSSADEMLSALQINPKDVLKRLSALERLAPAAAVREEATHAYRLTLESAWLLSHAVDAARRQGAPQVTALHLLAALLTMTGPAQGVLVTRLGLRPDLLPGQMQSAVSGAGSRRIPLADDLQRILGYAIGEAWNRRHLAVTPLHLAMGMARTEGHAAKEILAELGVSQSDFQEALEAAMPPPVLH